MLSLPEGFNVRPATLDDAQAVTDLVNACGIAERGHPITDISSILNDWKISYCDPQKNVRLVFDGATLVGYGGVWLEPPYVQNWGWGRTHPEYKGRGIGTFLAQWLKQRASAVALPGAPENARVVIHQWKLAKDEDSRDLLVQNGYTVVRRGYRMRIELNGAIPEPQFPEGIVIRTFDRPAHMRALVQAEHDIFQDHWGYVDLPFEQDLEAWEHWIDHDPHHDPSLWFLAMDGDRIAAVCLCAGFVPEDQDMGYVESLGVQRDWRCKGMGLALLHHCFGEFKRRGKKRVTLDVDAQSLTGATRLYERAGMHVYRENLTYELLLREGEDLSTQTLDSVPA